MKKLFIIICSLFVGIANADNVITSKEYVDTAGAALQPEISAKNTNTVLTYPAAGTETPGEKAIYDASADYATQSDALVTAGQFNTALQTALDTEFVCVERIDAGCLLYAIRGAGRNLFDKSNPDLQYRGYIAMDSVGQMTHLVSNPTQGDRTLFVPVRPNTTYTLQRRTDVSDHYNRIRTCVFFGANLPVANDPCLDLTEIMDATTKSVTFTTPANATYIGVYVRNLVAQPTAEEWQAFLDGFQVEVGEYATPYVPYGNVYMPQGQ